MMESSCEGDLQNNWCIKKMAAVQIGVLEAIIRQSFVED
jgi:hypothetical protein